MEHQICYPQYHIIQHPSNVCDMQTVLIPLNINIIASIEPRITTDVDNGNGAPNTTKTKQEIDVFSRFQHIQDRKTLPRAQAVLPTCLKYRNGVVLPKNNIPGFTMFGPAEGIKEIIDCNKASELIRDSVIQHKPVYLTKNSDGSFTHINVSDEDKSNWFGLLSLGDNKTANMWLYTVDNKIYGVTTNTIESKQCLTIGYTKEYADEIGMSSYQPVLDLCEEMKRERTKFQCVECNLSVASVVDLESHNNTFHKVPVKRSIKQQKHRCSHCHRRFSRVFCLKRHQEICSKKNALTLTLFNKSPDNPNTPKNELLTEERTNENIETELQNITDETKLPSNESLQNYTNLLDFSTNLFDPDRIGIDISGSLNLLKDDCRLENDFEFSAPGLVNSSPKKVLKNKKNVRKRQFTSAKGKLNPSFSCPHCKEALIRSKYLQHSRKCPSRRFTCHCGKKFNQKSMFALHVVKEHPNRRINSKPTNTNINKIDVEESALIKYNSEDTNENESYPCPKCSARFKRRGMLINHLSRLHFESPTAATVPLVVRAQRFPCPLCPKLYTSASKRKSHLALRHPDETIPPSRLEAIEVSRLPRPPANCSYCQRQYATRAKLLQHLRKAHKNELQPVS